MVASALIWNLLFYLRFIILFITITYKLTIIQICGKNNLIIKDSVVVFKKKNSILPIELLDNDYSVICFVHTNNNIKG